MLGLTSGLHADPTLLNGYRTCWSIFNDSESNRLHMRIFVRYETFYDRLDQVLCINQTIQIVGTKSLTFLSYHSHCCALCNSSIIFDWKLHGVCVELYGLRNPGSKPIAQYFFSNLAFAEVVSMVCLIFTFRAYEPPYSWKLQCTCYPRFVANTVEP